MKIKVKKNLSLFQAYEVKQEELKHLKGGDDVVIQDLIDG